MSQLQLGPLNPPRPHTLTAHRIEKLCQEILSATTKQAQSSMSLQQGKQLRENIDNLVYAVTHLYKFRLFPLLMKTAGRLLNNYGHSNDGAALSLAICNCESFQTTQFSDDNSNDHDSFELLCDAAPSWLTQVLANIEKLVEQGGSGGYFGIETDQDSKGEHDDQLDTTAITLHLEVITALVTSCRHRVRSGGTTASIIEQLNRKVWNVLGHKKCDSKIIQAATTCIAAIPLLGQKSSKPTSDMWSQCLTLAVAKLALCIHASWSTHSLGYSNHENSSSIAWAIKDGIGDEDQWLVRFKPSVVDQETRMVVILHRVEVMVELIISLLRIKGYDRKNCEFLLNFAEIPLQRLLQVSEMLIRFGTSAESQVISRSSAARAEISAASSLLSPKSAASLMLPIIKFGHRMLRCLISTTSSNLIPYTKNIANIINVSVSSSSSAAVMLALSKSHQVSLHPEGQWKNKSARARREPIDTMRTALLSSLGCSLVPMIEKSFLFASGYLIEQTILGGRSYELGGDWCSLGDKTELIHTTCEALTSALHVGGSFITITCRAGIEKAVYAILTAFMSDSEAMMYSIKISTVKKSILRLARAVIMSPWQDSGTSSLTIDIHSVASKLKLDNDVEVIASAQEVLCLCDAVILPRAPPLIVPPRSAELTAQYVVEDISQNVKLKQDEISKHLSLKREEESKPIDFPPKRQRSDNFATESNENKSQSDTREDIVQLEQNKTSSFEKISDSPILPEKLSDMEIDETSKEIMESSIKLDEHVKDSTEMRRTANVRHGHEDKDDEKPIFIDDNEKESSLDKHQEQDDDSCPDIFDSDADE